MSRNTDLLGMNSCLTVLIIEDSPEDYEFTTRALSQSGYIGNCHHAKNGDEALDYLKSIETQKQNGEIAEYPSLIFLDLNMPAISGFDILQSLKNHDDFKRIPVLVISTSERKEDVVKSYHLGANSYIHKSVNYQALKESISLIKSYWLDSVILPDPHFNAFEKKENPTFFVKAG